MAIIDYTTVRRFVEGYINDKYSTTPVQYENEHIDVENVKEYVAVTDTTIDSNPAAISSPAILVHGAIVIQIYTELGKGTKRGRQIASELTTLFNGEAFSNFNFTAPQFDSIGQVEDVDYYQCNLSIPYVYAFGAEEFEVC